MTENSVLGDSSRREHRAGWPCTGRMGGLPWGILFLAGGFLWFGKSMGWFTYHHTLFWPLAVMAIGAWLVAAAIIRLMKRS
ncbi:MAG: hypothetical protein MUC76_02165 [Spirochaetes bacterium]|nr:hypothetical protein [Spirochaetota bacterium]